MSNTPLLDTIHVPHDTHDLTLEQLKQLALELRQETIDAVSQTGGHLGAGLGVIELTVALHYIFDTPKDKLIWDVGHQTYPHKILTGRRNRIRTIRQGSGLSPFTKRSESEFDPFGAGHSSTSISASLGMAVARDMKGEDHEVIAVIGDGAMSGGMAFEALNNAGSIDSKLIVILNDNDMSISPPVGALSNYFSRLISSHPYISLRNMAKRVLTRFPKAVGNAVKKTEQYAKNMATGHGNLFEEMGFTYIGPIDGHNLDHLVPVLRNVRNRIQNHPVLIHIVTEKGYGFDSTEASAEKYHAVKQFDAITRIQTKSAPAKATTYTKAFADSLITEAKYDDKIVAITAAMPSGTGLDIFKKIYPERTFDVGIAEQHAVTFAAGLAAEGYKPFVAIYSTFLQRAYDQIVHDVAIQKLPVRFAIDRAGLVGADGPTHAGSFDITYLATLPNFIVMAASDEQELAHMVATAASINDCPCAFRYPRGEGIGLELAERGTVLEIGKGRIIKHGNKIAILSLGTRLEECLKAAEQLGAKGLSTTVADARFAKPLDTELIKKLAEEHEVLITIEEGSSGGFGAHVLQFLSDEGLLETYLKVRTMCLPDCFIQHNTPYTMYEEAGLNAKHIIRTVLGAINTEESSNISHAL